MEAPAGKNTLMPCLEMNIPQCRVNVLYKVVDAIAKPLSTVFWMRRKKNPLIVQNVNWCDFRHQQLASSVAVSDFIECTKDVDIIG